MKRLFLTIVAFSALATYCSAAAIGIAISSDSKSLRDENNVVLSGGNVNVNRDGTQVLLGYFSDATQSAPFGSGSTDRVGTFIALTGPGTPAWGAAGSINNFTIGDDVINSTNNGELFKEAFAINTGVADSLLPSAGTPLILRFFNSSKQQVLDLANVNGAWNWKLPSTPPATLNINLDDPGLVSRGIGSTNSASFAVSPSTTNLQTLNPAAIPEPNTCLLALGGLVTLFGRRRKR